MMRTHCLIFGFLFFAVIASSCQPGSTPSGSQEEIDSLSFTSTHPPEDHSILPTETPHGRDGTPSRMDGESAEYEEPQYAVILVSEGDVLNMRSAPGVGNPIVDTLAAQATGILHTGKYQGINGSQWAEVTTPAGIKGWVNAHYLTEYKDPQAFCQDERVGLLIDRFILALQAQDGRAIVSLISPIHGLTIRVSWWNPEVNFPFNEIGQIFTDDQSQNWGVQDGSGSPIVGSFSEVVFPLLQEVVNSPFSSHCNDIEGGTGGSAGWILWPYEYRNINFVALYREALPGDELNWRTWAIGVEYVAGEPTIAFLVQYHWEI